ncbi:MAG: nucleotidyltransferase family protein, partial [Pseudomonadota bacterium]
PGNLVWAAADEDGRQGHPVLFSSALFTRLMALEGDDGARSVIKAAGGGVHLIPLPGGRARRDLDTPEAWRAWRAERRKLRD